MTACTLRAWWGSTSPRVGHYLKAPKGRTAYEIVSIRRVSGAPLGGQRFVLTCVRHAPQDVPEGATVHRWTWDKRGKRR